MIKENDMTNTTIHEADTDSGSITDLVCSDREQVDREYSRKCLKALKVIQSIKVMKLSSRKYLLPRKQF